MTTGRVRRQRPAPNLVNRQFRADGCDRLWVADTTYIPTWTGFLYLAGVIDAFSRKVVGWSMLKGNTSSANTAPENTGYPPRQSVRRKHRPPPWITLHLFFHRLENQAITCPWDGVNFTHE